MLVKSYYLNPFKFLPRLAEIEWTPGKLPTQAASIIAIGLVTMMMDCPHILGFSSIDSKVNVMDLSPAANRLYSKYHLLSHWYGIIKFLQTLDIDPVCYQHLAQQMQFRNLVQSMMQKSSTRPQWVIVTWYSAK